MKSFKLFIIFVLCFFLIYESRAQEDFVKVTPLEFRNWMPGENWNENKQEYDVPAPIVTNTTTFNINNSIPKGKYLLVLAILDPAGMVPSVKFATSQYFNGGLHPIGYIGVETNISETSLATTLFDDPSKDNSLYYIAE